MTTTPNPSLPHPEQPPRVVPSAAGAEPVLPPPPMPPAPPTTTAAAGFEHAPAPSLPPSFATQSGVSPAGPTPSGYAPHPGFAQPIPASALALELRKIGTSWQVPAMAVAIMLLVGLAMGACLVAMLDDATDFIARGVPWVQKLLLGFGIVLGGGVKMEGAAALSGGVGVASLGTIAAMGMGSYLVARRVAQRESGPAGSAGAVLVRSLVEALPAALIALFLAIFGRAGNTVLLVSPALVGVLFTVWLTVALALFFARMRFRGVSRWGGASALVREPVWYATILVGAMSIVVLIAFIVVSIKDGTLVALLWLPYGLNAAAYTAALGQFGQLAGTGMTSTGIAMAWDILGGFAILLILVTMLVLLYLGVFLGARRGRVMTFAPHRVWQLPLGVLVLSIAFTYTLGSVTLGGIVSDAVTKVGGDVWIGLTFVTSLIVAVFALAVSLLAEVMPGIAYTLSPKFFAFLVGQRVAQAWVAGVPMAPGGGPGGGYAGGGYAGGGYQPPGPPPIGYPVAPTGFPPAQTGFPQAPTGYPTVPSGPAHAPSGASQAPSAPGHAPYGYAAPAAMAVPPPPRAPMSRKARRAVIASVVSVGVIGVLVGGAAIALTVINENRGPESVVQEYLDHLAAGDADAASAMVPLSSGDASDLTRNDVYNAEGVEHFTVGDITSEVDGDSGVVTAELTLGGESYEVDIAVSTGESEFGLLRTWVIDDPLVFDAEVWATGAADVEIAGSEQTLSEQEFGYSATFTLYPGIYPVTLNPDSEYLSGDEASLLAAPGEPIYVDLEASLSDETKTEVLAKVKEFVAACAEVPTNMSHDCPEDVRDKNLDSLELTTQVSELAWLDVSDLSFETDNATITIVANPTTANPNPKPQEVEFAVGGAFSLDGDEIEIEISYIW